MTSASAATTAGSPRRRARRRVFALLLVLLLVGVLEVGGAVAWSLATGSLFTWSRAAAARERARAGDIDAGADRDEARRAADFALSRRVMVHPFLGYVTDPGQRDRMRFPVSSYGFLDTASPIRKRSPDTYVIGIVGGSVALQFGLYAREELVRALQRSPTLRDRRIELVNLANGGYKQPQQLFALQMVLALGGEFDCVLNIDGFNEVALVNENVPHGVPAWYPRSWARLLEDQPAPEQQLRIGKLAVLGEQRLVVADLGDTFGWSPLAQFLWLQSDRSVAKEQQALRAEIERAAARPTSAVLGPGTEGRDLVAARQHMVEVWERCSRLLRAACEANGVRYLHFLQPNQYLPDSKPIGAEEARVAFDPDHPWRGAVVDGYPELLRRGAAMREEGFPFVDLTGVFREHPEPLYVDTCCHVGPRGNALLAAHIGAAVRRSLDLDDGGFRELRVAATELELASPLQRTPLVVEARTGDDRWIDVSGAGFGVRYDVAPAGALEIDAAGVVRPLRRGTASITVAHPAGLGTVVVKASWPDLLVGDDGIAPADSAGSPVLQLDTEQFAAGAPRVRARCSDVAAGPFRFVAVSRRPLPDSPIGAETHDLQVLPLVGDGPTIDIDLPIAAPSGVPVYARIYVLNAKADTVLAASATVVMTRG